MLAYQLSGAARVRELRLAVFLYNAFFCESTFRELMATAEGLELAEVQGQNASVINVPTNRTGNSSWINHSAAEQRATIRNAIHAGLMETLHIECSLPDDGYCRQVCEGSEEQYVFRLMSSQLQPRFVMMFPFSDDPQFIPMFAANQSCVWNFILPENAVGAQMEGHLEVDIQPGDASVMIQSQGRQEVNASYRSAYTMRLPLPITVTFQSGAKPAVGGFRFIWGQQVVIPRFTWGQICTRMLGSLGSVAMLSCMAACMFRRRIDQWLEQDIARAEFVRRLRIWVGLSDADIDQLCPAEDLCSSFTAEFVEDCTVCLEGLQAGQRVRRMRCPARHVLHAECAQEWLRRRDTCPTCRFQHTPLLRDVTSANSFRQSVADSTRRSRRPAGDATTPLRDDMEMAQVEDQEARSGSISYYRMLADYPQRWPWSRWRSS